MTSPTGTVRRVEGSDLARLDAAYPEPSRPSSRHRDRWDLQERRDGQYLVAWDRDHPIGWVFVGVPGSSETSIEARRVEAAEVIDLYVSPDFRGRSCGSALLEAAERLARDAGWTKIGLSVTVSNPHNDVARAMYARHGFRDAGLGEFKDGYYCWTESGERRRDGELHRFLIKPLSE